MNPLYTRLHKTAGRLLAQYGQPIILRHTQEGVYDHDTGIVSTDVAEENCRGVVDNYQQSDIDGTVVQQGDVLVVLQAAMKPQTGDLLVLADSTVLTVKAVQAENPAGLAVVYKVQCHG